MISFLVFHTVVVLGFLTSEVSGMEGSTVQISVGVSQGFLGLSVSGTVLTADGSAEGRYNIHGIDVQVQ